jgi:hypothetical protein
MPLLGKIPMPLLGKISLGIGVMAAAAWITLALLKGDVPIHVVEATFGLNCKDYEVKPPNQNKVSIGNFTNAVKEVCGNFPNECRFEIYVDEELVGDPAPGCEKDFSVAWKCGGAEDIYRAYAWPPAENKAVYLSC